MVVVWRPRKAAAVSRTPCPASVAVTALRLSVRCSTLVEQKTFLSLMMEDLNGQNGG